MEMQNLDRNWINSDKHIDTRHDNTKLNNTPKGTGEIIMKRFRGGVTVGEFSFIHAYSEEKIKKIVKKVKELDKEFIKMMATDLLQYISNDISIHIPLVSESQSECSSPKILLLHCPSTAFALGMKKADHMAEVLKMIHTLAMQKLFNQPCGLRIDLALHAFCIRRTKRVSQHTKSMHERLVSSQEKYMQVIPFSKTFKRVLRKYDAIYILDDVVTTGSTLAVIREILSVASGSNALGRITSVGYAH